MANRRSLFILNEFLFFVFVIFLLAVCFFLQNDFILFFVLFFCEFIFFSVVCHNLSFDLFFTNGIKLMNTNEQNVCECDIALMP